MFKRQGTYGIVEWRYVYKAGMTRNRGYDVDMLLRLAEIVS